MALRILGQIAFLMAFWGALSGGTGKAEEGTKKQPLTHRELLESMAKKGTSRWVPTEPSERIKRMKGGLTLEEQPLTNWDRRSPVIFGDGPGFGARRQDDDQGPQISSALPERHDWRQHNGIDYMTPVGQPQGECGACVAFATAATVEAQLNIACEATHDPFQLSQQYLFSCGGGDCDGGWLLTKAVAFTTDQGLPDSICFPYQAAMGENVACDLACDDVHTRLFRGFKTERITRGFVDIEAIKRGLLKGPLLANMVLFEDLKSYDSGVYEHIAGLQEGGHAIVLVGWDNADRSWIVRNSWGPDWGEGGYFKASWDDSSLLLGRYTYHFDVSTAVANGACSR